MGHVNSVLILLITWASFCNIFAINSDSSASGGLDLTWLEFVCFSSLLFSLLERFLEVPQLALLSAADLQVLLVLIVLVLLFGMSVVAFFAPSLPFANLSRSERVNLLIQGTQKTLTLGVPLVNILFGDEAGLLSLPLFVYYPLSLIVHALLLPRLKQWSSPADEEQIDLPAPQPAAGERGSETGTEDERSSSE